MGDRRLREVGVSRADAAVILPAAGKGTRLGEAKQFLELGGIPLLARAAMGAAACEDVAAIVVAAPAGEEERVRTLLEEHGAADKLVAVVAGGAERADSVRAALDAVPADLRLVAIHDAARPFATPGLFSRVLEVARSHGAAIAALPCTDTVKQTESPGSRTATASVDRRRLWLAQTPQAFHVDLLRASYQRLGSDSALVTDEASLVEAMGHGVELVVGEKNNFKVTDMDDLVRARSLVGPPVSVGFGYDVHAYEAGRPCILGGIEFPGEVGLAGHSDADAGLHAIMDAILGAAGLGDIGQHFPDTDDRFRGADSGRLLEEVVARARGAGWTIGNVDLTLIASRPKIGPRRDEMRQRIAELLGIREERVNVKATTTEGLGFVGRKEGLAAQAVVLLSRC